jgi:hypothetical protein
MGRWTENKEELDHLVKIVKQMDTDNGTVALNDGRKFYGIILPGRLENSVSGQSRADIVIRIKNKKNQLEDHKFDVLDVSEIIPRRLS